MRSILTITAALLMLTGSAVASLNDGLVAYYPFNGNANDESGNANHGTVFGATLAEERFGNAASAYSFDGVDDYIEIQDSTDFEFTNSLTISAWILPKNPGRPAGRTIFSKYADENAPGIFKDQRSYLLTHHHPSSWPGSRDALHFALTTGSGTNTFHLYTEEYVIKWDSWQHVAATWDGHERNIYLNGVRIATDLYSSPLYQTPAKARIGWYYARVDAGHFEGLIDEIYIYNRGLSEVEIQQLFGLIVEIDIKPGSHPNCFNNDGNGVIPVAILGSVDFDVTQIDADTVELEGMPVAVKGKSNKLLAHIENVNGDAYDDLVIQIEDIDGAFSDGDTTATLTGKLKPEFGGTFFEGTDTICIVGNGGNAPPLLKLGSKLTTTWGTIKKY